MIEPNGPTNVAFGRYDLHCLLGEGGMARVYRASLTGPLGFRKEVAIKRIPRAVTEDERVVRALVNEARLGGRLRHPNIVEILEFGEIREEYYLVMELVEGWTLQTILSRSRKRAAFLPPTVVVDVLVSVLRALRHAHELADERGQSLQVIHRDIKPGNVMVTRQGDVKLMDFGVAKAASNLYKTTKAGVAKGTPAYMSPQQIRAEDLDGRSDLFSVGALLHETATLRLPFAGSSVPAVVFAVLEGDLGPAKARMFERSPALWPLVEALMAPNPNDRPQSAREALVQLEKVGKSLGPGPSLVEWLEESGPSLPERPIDGLWGEEGAPPPVLLDEKRAVTVEFSVWSERLHDTDPLSTPGGGSSPQRMGSSAGTSLGASLAEPPLPTRSVTNRSQSGDTVDLSPMATPQTVDLERGGPSGDETEAVRNAADPPLSPARLVVAGLGGAIVTAIIVLALLPERPKSAQERPPTPDSAVPSPMTISGPNGATSARTPSPEPTATARPDGEAAPSAVPDPRATTAPENAAGPSAAAPRVVPGSRRPVPSGENQPMATPQEAPSAQSAAPGVGYLQLNSNPWSSVELDGEAIGFVPIDGRPVPAGKHTLRFRCDPPACDPAVVRTIEADVGVGETERHIVRFREGTPAAGQ